MTPLPVQGVPVNFLKKHGSRALAVLSALLAAHAFTVPAQGKTEVDLPSVRTTGGANIPPDLVPAGLTVPTDAAAAIGSIWKACYEIENNAQDIINQDKYWFPRKDWLGYYASNIDQYLTVLKQDVALDCFKGAAGGTAGLDQVTAAVSDMADSYGKLVQAINKVPAQQPEDLSDMSKYPPGRFNLKGPAKALYDDAVKLDGLVMDIYGKLSARGGDSSATAAPAQDPANAAAGGGETGTASSTILQGGAQVLQLNSGTHMISQAAREIKDSANNLIGELERWNLLYGQPPSGQAGSTLPYGGGLTPAEIVTQYKYLPTFAFTMPYYTRFSYRLPPRHKYLALYTTQIGKAINLMAAEIEDTKLPSDKAEALQGPWNTVKELFKDVVDNYMDLLKQVNESNDARLSKNIREDEISFGRPATAIYDSMDKLNRILADINKMASR